MQRSFAIDKAIGSFESRGLKKRRAPNKDTDGAVVHKFRVSVDVWSSDTMKKMEALFPDAEAFAKAVARDESKGTILNAKEKLGIVEVQCFDFREGNLLFEDTRALAGIPRLVIGQSAKEARFIVDVELAIPRPLAGLVVDYFRADTMWTIRVTQMTLADAKKEAAEARADREANEAAAGEDGKGKKKGARATARRGKAPPEPAPEAQQSDITEHIGADADADGDDGEITVM